MGLVPAVVRFRGCVMTIRQDETHFGGHFGQEGRGRFTISAIGGSEQSREGKPDACDKGDDVQFPAVDPAMPARFGPVGFGINGSMRHQPLLTMFLMLDASSGL